METLQSNNAEWGLFGTIARATENRALADHVWQQASIQIREITGFSPEAVRDFLDSSDGRHFADTVSDGIIAHKRGTADAVRCAIIQWMGWSVGARTAMRLRLPYGRPLLWALVRRFQN